MTLMGTAGDAEDGDLSGSISWSSNLDGGLGTGASVTTSSLSVGVHVITASVTDSGVVALRLWSEEGELDAAPGAMLAARIVPAVVPSVSQSSVPFVPSSAVKNIRLPHFAHGE